MAPAPPIAEAGWIAATGTLPSERMKAQPALIGREKSFDIKLES
jgi:hypothetical protein